MAFIPEQYMDAVVAIGAADNSGKLQWRASGFFYGRFLKKQETGERIYECYLISNRHVFAQLSGQAFIRVNPQADEAAKEYPFALLDENGVQKWQGHPDATIDVAAIPINLQLLRNQKMRVFFFPNDSVVADRGRLKEIGVTEGDSTFVLGFPMGFVGNWRNTVIVRGATIARIRDSIAGKSHSYLIDAPVFPGNSGGPVILKPAAVALEGTKAHSRAELIGIVTGYLPYEDVAISAQTGRPRVVFSENSGLATVHPMDLVEETISYLESVRASVKAVTP